jgi:outer membrane protein assembly factor BamB/tRNA A-37 threonylcarbamoyl transferase component Bud32
METHRITQPLDEHPKKAHRQLQPGSVLQGRYAIQEIIGHGGMSSVYRARDLHFPNVLKLVAVKEMVITTNDEKTREMIVKNFEREANLLATLNHPGIPKIFDYFSTNDRSYLVLDFIHDKDLDQILNESDGFLPESQVVQWALELCDVLSYLHNHKPEPIIFRDMKPSNVMVRPDGHIVLIDFGIAKRFQAGQRGTMIGTEGYSPPEQYRGEATTQADIYALGATLHHLLTRRDPRLEPPFSFAERPIRQINPAVSPELVAVIEKALQYNPEDRYKTIDEMREALVNAARRTGMLGSIPAATAIIKNSDIKPLWVFSCEDEIRGTPLVYQDLVYIGSYDHNLYALNIEKGEFIWKYATDGGIVGRPAIYEDNVIFGSEDKQVYAVHYRTGRLVWTAHTEGPVRGSPRIADGHAFIGSDDTYLYALNTETGYEAWRMQLGGAIRSTPWLTREEIFVGTEEGDFYCLDFRGQVKWTQRAKRAITSSPTVRDGIVYFASLDGMVYALEAASGWMVWRFRMGKGSISSPAVDEKLLYIGSIDKHIYAVDLKNGREAWRYRTDHQVNSSPVRYRDAVYVGSADGCLYCLDAATGQLRWKFQTEGPITGTPVIYNDIVYIGSTDHKIYALLA